MLDSTMGEERLPSLSRVTIETEILESFTLEVNSKKLYKASIKQNQEKMNRLVLSKVCLLYTSRCV